MNSNPQFWTIEGVERNALMSRAEEYSTSSSVTYNPGDWVWHESSTVGISSGLYVCKVQTTGGNWNSNHWTSMEDISKLFSISNKQLTDTITETVPATAMRVSISDPELYDLRTGAADPWDRKLDTDSMGEPWTEKSYSAGEFCTYQGKSYMANSVITSSDVPGSSEKWTESKLSVLFSSTNTATDPAPSGILKNVELDKSIVKVCNSIVSTPNTLLESALSGE